MKTSQLLILSILLFAYSCGNEAQSEPADTEVQEVSEELDENEEVNEVESELESSYIEDCDNARFKEKMIEGNNVLVDVRTAEEFEAGHIEGAINIDFYSEDFEQKIDELDPMVPVLVYCKAGGRSGQARDMMASKNFIEIYNLKDGFGNWEE